MNNLKYIIRQLSLLTQLGLSLVVPILLCLFLCWFLNDRFDIGGWIYIPGFIMGLGSSFMTAYKFYLFESKKTKKDDAKKKVSFNRHS